MKEILPYKIIVVTTYRSILFTKVINEAKAPCLFSFTFVDFYKEKKNQKIPRKKIIKKFQEIQYKNYRNIDKKIKFKKKITRKLNTKIP